MMTTPFVKPNIPLFVPRVYPSLGVIFGSQHLSPIFFSASMLLHLIISFRSKLAHSFGRFASLDTYGRAVAGKKEAEAPVSRVESLYAEGRRRAMQQVQRIL
jgi:hypothetical protein